MLKKKHRNLKNCTKGAHRLFKWNEIKTMILCGLGSLRETIWFPSWGDSPPQADARVRPRRIREGIPEGGSLKLLAVVLLLVITSFLSVSSREIDKIIVTELNIETVDEVEVLEIVLNDQIRIREIEIGEFAERTIVKFPAFISRRGVVFPHVEVLKEELQNEIIKAVEKNSPSDEEPGKLHWEITRLTEFRGPGRTRAHFSITFNDALRINGRVMERADGTVWIAWPSRPPQEGESGWQRQVEILDRELRQNIEKALIENYEKL